MTILQRIRRSVRRQWRQRRALRQLGELAHLKFPQSVALERALEKSITDRLSPDEQAQIESIESMRQRLLLSHEEVKQLDFGAGHHATVQPDAYVTRIVGEVCKSASKPRRWATLLFHLIRELRPSTCVELGTCLGISAMYQASALRFNGRGRLITLEGSEEFSRIATANFASGKLDNIEPVVGRFADTLPGVLRAGRPIEYVFIDGHHEEKATLAYFNQFVPFLSSNAILVFDDIDWSEGMKRAWATIQADERIRLSLDLQQIGLCLLDASIQQKSSFKIQLP